MLRLNSINKIFGINKITRVNMSMVKLSPITKTIYDIKQGPEITLYIKGFLSRNEKPQDFQKWINTHDKIVNKYNWNKHIKGWYWDCGKIKYPIPFMTSAHTAYSVYKKTKILRLNPWILAGSALFDAGLFATRMMYEYKHAEQNTHKLAHQLAHDLIKVSDRYEKVRIVAHSLGCKLLMNAIIDIPPKYRPDIIHLCAPAFVEEDYGYMLNEISKDKTYLYYTNNDIILNNILQLILGKSVCGADGLKKEYHNIITTDVSEYFKNHWMIHNNYKNELHNFISYEI